MHSRSFKQTILCLALSMGVTALASGHSSSLSLSPAVITLEGQPGQSTRQQLMITNDTTREFAFELIAEDVVVVDGKRAFVPAGEIPRSIAATAVFKPASVRVLPGQSATVDAIFTVPPGVTHRAVAAIFRATNTSQTEKVGMTISLGTLLTFNLSKDASIKTSEITVGAQTATRSSSFSQSIANSGTEPVIPKGTAAVLNDSGVLVGKALFDPHRLLPGEKAEFRTEYPGELKAGRYRVLATFQFGGQTVTSTGDFVVK